ncbi:hypothetical protein A2Z00_04970 [Candidatus Gottesmanbacteria bacterium RBG_13_45_10]|uniref:CBS domain-containing protein n=1 Tax=Candidatus Gottesmanbacteria bacterium RBG_13_45_10 TaxID=1798370 RepID=A0A1F5ZGD5_9BACT|nr:MAG: hypothetical protein A2Z00_04970 [Candidatus Gottesmanbacteria bacterium RBG_13_45_10]
MVNDTQGVTPQQESYMLNDLIGTKVLLHGKKIGVLNDILVRENGSLPVVTHFLVSRPFGNPSLLIPWDNIRVLTVDEIVVNILDIKEYEREPDISLIKLKDHILDKKVLDIEDRDIDVVYDIRLVSLNNQLLISDVDTSKTGLLRRVGLGWLANKLSNSTDKNKIISWKYIQPLSAPLGRFKGDVRLNIFKERLAEIHPVDLADILEELDFKQRAEIFGELDTQKASDTLEEIDPKSQRELVASLNKERIVQLLTHMTAGQAADILSVLPYSEVRIILHLLDKQHVHKIKSIMNKQEEDIENYATSRFIKFPPDMSVEEARNKYYQAAKDKKVVMYLYITDDKDKLLGVVDIKRLLRAARHKKLKDIEVSNVISLTPKSTLRQALHLFERYDYRAIPIVDRYGTMLGVVPYRDLKRLKHRFLE